MGSILARNPRLRTVRVGNTLVCPVEQIIIKAMQQSPAMRFQSADAMRTALQQCLPSNGTVNTTIQIPAMNPNATILVPRRGSASNNANTGNGLICPKCGFQNRPGAKFCKRDGQPLVPGATTVPPQIRASADTASVFHPGTPGRSAAASAARLRQHPARRSDGRVPAWTAKFQ